MLHLIAALYDLDTIRFASWHLLGVLHLDTGIINTLASFGLTVWEDFSISR